MNRCRCGSYAINPDHHGREGDHLDLCDVCYWRKRHEECVDGYEWARAGNATLEDHLRRATADMKRMQEQRDALAAERDALQALATDLLAENAGLKNKAETEANKGK